jgi:aryl-alcohol dehydrogenase-like predicted oxidoreductase
MKLALGTVQFGLDYGIANAVGRVPSEEISGILATARRAGITVLDTAVAYGDSEERLGDAGVDDFSVVSKLPSPMRDAATIAIAVRASLARLRRPELYGLLLHRSSDLLGNNGDEVFAALCALKHKGLVKKIGVSIYDPEELAPLIDRYDIDLVQSPYNVLDRRIATSGWLGRLKERGIEVHARSAFLQGLLLMRKAQRPARFAQWAPQLDAWDEWLVETAQSPLAGALSFVIAEGMIDRVVVGVDSDRHLQEIVAASGLPGPPAPLSLASNDRHLINPAMWNIP